MNLRSIAIGIALVSMSAAGAANECQPDIDLIDANLTSTAPVTAEQFKEAKDLRDRGAELCVAGEVADGRALLEQAKAILGIQ